MACNNNNNNRKSNRLSDKIIELRKVWDTPESREERAKERPIFSSDIGEHLLARVLGGEDDDYRFLDLVQFYNKNKYRTLFDAKLLFISFYAGTPGKPDAIRYKMISREEADKIYQKPIDYNYTIEDFKPHKIERKAKLVARRSKKNLTYLNRHKRHAYMISQTIKLGDMPPMSSKFILTSTLGSDVTFTSQARLMGDTWGTYQDDLRELARRKLMRKSKHERARTLKSTKKPPVIEEEEDEDIQNINIKKRGQKSTKPRPTRTKRPPKLDKEINIDDR